LAFASKTSQYDAVNVDRGEFISKNAFENGARASGPHAGKTPALRFTLYVILLMN
jgi:hypothetical protein